MTRAEDLFGRIEAHGMDAIHAMLRDAKSEEAFLNFKQSGDAGRGTRLHDSDAKNLSKALSGFANADGGVIIWRRYCNSTARLGRRKSSLHRGKPVAPPTLVGKQALALIRQAPTTITLVANAHYLGLAEET